MNEYATIEDIKMIQEDIREIKDDIKTIMDVLVPKLNPKQGIISRMEVLETDIKQLQIDLIKRHQSARTAAIVWSVVSSSLVTTLIIGIIGLLLRGKAI